MKGIKTFIVRKRLPLRGPSNEDDANSVLPRKSTNYRLVSSFLRVCWIGLANLEDSVDVGAIGMRERACEGLLADLKIRTAV